MTQPTYRERLENRFAELQLGVMRAHIARGYYDERLYQISQYRQLIAQYEHIVGELRHGTTR